AALDAANGADLECDVLARNEHAGRTEHAFHPGACIGSAAYNLDRLATLGDLAGIDCADTQPIGIGMLLGGEYAADHVGRQRLRLVLDVLDLEPDHRELIGDLREGCVGVEMLPEPSLRELHALRPPASVGKSSGRK